MEILTHKNGSLKNIRSKMTERCIWIKIVNGVFQVDDKPLGPVLKCTIEKADYHNVKFVNGQPERRTDLSREEAATQGFEQEVTLSIRIDGKLYGLRVPKGSVSTKFEPYVDLLLSKGLEYLFQVTTSITATHIASVKFPYHILSFELVEVKDTLKSAA